MSIITGHPIFAPTEQGALQLGKGRENSKALVYAIVASLIVSLILIWTEGNVFTATAVVLAGFVVFITCYRIDWGFYLFIGSVLFFDQYAVPEFQPFTYQAGYFLNLKQTYLLNVGPAVFNPLELHLLLIIFVWVVMIAMKKSSVLSRVPVWFSAFFFFYLLIFSFVKGLIEDGDFLPALWEIRGLFYLGIMYFLVPQIIQTKAQVTTIMWICIFTISFKAFQGIERFVRLDFSFQGITTLIGHEDATFIVTLVMFLLALLLFGGHAKQRRMLLFLLIPLILGFVVGQRRAAFGSMGASLIALIILIPKKERWMLLRVIIPIILIFGCYLAVFWNSQASIAQPAALVRTSFSNDREAAGDRYWSNVYRVYERYNLATTIKRSPLIGIGFGNKYDMPIKLAEIPYSLRDYIAHNEILWLLAKMGAVGFFGFWLFLNSFVFQGASIFSRLRDSYLKAVCAVVIIAVINQIFVSYLDLQLTFYRNMVYLGVLMGFLPILENLDQQSSPINYREST